MAHKLPDDAEAVGFDIILYCPRNINYSFARQGLGDALVKGLFRNIHELLGQHAAAPNRHRPGSVADEPVVNDPDIQTDDVPKAQEPGAG